MSANDRLDRAERVAFAVVSALGLAWCFTALTYPLGYDQGMMAEVGDVIVRGGLPYRDGFDLKGPLTFYLFAALEVVFGRVAWAIRLFDVVLLLVSAFMMFRLLRRVLGSEIIARWIALCLVLTVASRGWFFTAQPDGWAAALVVAGVTPRIGRDVHSRCDWLVSGFCIGLAALIKPLFLVFLSIPLVIGLGSGLGIAPAALSLVGAVLPIAATLGWFAAKNGLHELIAVYIRFNAEAYSGVERFDVRGAAAVTARYLWNGGRRPFWPEYVPPGPFPVLLVPIAAGAILAWKEWRNVGLPLLAWAASAVACVAIQTRGLVYHWLIAFPPILALAAVALAKLVEEGRAGRLMAATAIAVFVAGVGIEPLRDAWHLTRYVVGRDSRDEYLGDFQMDTFNALSAIQAAEYLKARTQPEDRVVTYGEIALVDFLAGRQSPTRFVFALPLNVSNRTYRDRFRAEFIADLTRVPPEIIVLGSQQDEQSLAEFPEFKKLLADHYGADTKFGRLKLYRLLHDD